MKRELLCASCGAKARKMFPNDSPHPGEHVKIVRGRAKEQNGCLHCDGCNAEILPGDDCAALSVWTDKMPLGYVPWEPGYLDVTKGDERK